MNTLKKAWYTVLSGGVVSSFTPASLGTKLKHWSEVYGLVAGQTNEYGIVASNGDVTQLSDLSGNENHFTVPSGSNPPNFDGTKVNFVKGSSESLYSPSLLTDLVSDTQGEIVFVVKKTAAENANLFCASHPSNIDKRSVLGIRDSDDKFFLQIKNLHLPLDVNTGSSAKVVTDTQLATISVRSNGTTYVLIYEINGERVEATLSFSQGSNDGRWWGDITPGNFSLFSLLDSSPVYYTGAYYALLACNEPLSTQERSDLFCYLNNKYSVWP